MLCIGQNGEYIARYTAEFHRECARGDLIPGEVLVQLLTYMHPMGEVPHPDMIRACIVFAFDHGWNIVKENLENEFEPPITPDEYMSQLMFGDKFDLKNLLRVNIQRAESRFVSRKFQLITMFHISVVVNLPRFWRDMEN